MRVSAAGPKKIRSEIELGDREIDIRFDQNASYHQYQRPNELPTFIQRSKDESQQRQRQPSQHPDIPNYTFSDEQQNNIDLVEDQIRYLQGDHRQSPPMSVMVQGKAGSGKSTLINYITSRLRQEFGNDSYALIAPTGAAALNINGSTVHSKLCVGITSILRPLGSERLNRCK